MGVKHYIHRIMEEGKEENMHCLSEMMDDLICDLKESDPELYKQYACKLHKLVYGDHLSEEMARDWVKGMKNKDGTVGEHWTWEQTSQYAEHYDKCDFYAVLNMMYSDYYNSRFDTSTYLALAKDWLDDPDVGKDKTLKYYMYVV